MLGLKDVKKRHMRKFKVAAVVLASVGILLAVGYVDYTIYKAKYPNTEFWMWLFDTK
jgi:hypothetical protein